MTNREKADAHRGRRSLLGLGNGYQEVDCSAHGFTYVPPDADTDCIHCRAEQAARNEREQQWRQTEMFNP